MRFLSIAILFLILVACAPAPGCVGRKTVPDKLEYYIIMNKLDEFKLLIEANPKYFNSVIREQYQEQPIHVASYYGRANFVDYLLSKGANIDAESNGSARTAILIAVWKNHEALAIKLLEMGADLKIKTRAGLTLCESAKRRKMNDLVKKIPGCL